MTIFDTKFILFDVSLAISALFRYHLYEAFSSVPSLYGMDFLKMGNFQTASNRVLFIHLHTLCVREFNPFTFKIIIIDEDLL